jgi:hypothetical protein
VFIFLIRHDQPRDVEDVLKSAQETLEFRSQNKDGKQGSYSFYFFDSSDTELIDNYLNGERTLSNNRLSYLVLSSQSTFPLQDGAENENSEQNFDLLICAAHFIGDGMALHTFANHLFGLLGSCLDEPELRVLLEQEFKGRREVNTNKV